MNLLRADTKFPNTIYMIGNPYGSYDPYGSAIHMVFFLKKSHGRSRGERRSKGMGEPTTRKVHKQCKPKHNNTMQKHVEKDSLT